MGRFGERVSILALAAFVVAAVMALAFAAGYVVGKLLL
jgi:hypothetical protein